MTNTRAFILSLVLATAGAAQSTTETSFAGLRESNPTPSFDHGYVAAWDLQHSHHSLTLYAPDGHQMFEVSSLELPDGKKTLAPISVAVDTDGTSAFAYAAEPGTRSGIALLDTAGKQIRIIEMEPYMPSQVCFAPDHSVWMFGDMRQSREIPRTDFMAFRHYGRDGKLLGSFIPRSSLPAWEAPGLDGVLRPVIGMWSMRATKDRIGARLEVGALKNAWVELDLNGNLIGKWIYTGTMNDWASPAAFDSKGLLYGIHWMDHKRVGLSVFDKATSTWNPIPTLPGGHLIAADGTRLVYQDGDQLRWIQGLNTDLAESASATQP